MQSCRGRKQNTRTHDKKGWSKSAQKKCPAMRTLAAISLLSGLLLGQPSRSQAGCGCDKPPPAPAAVIPNFAPGGTRVTLFYDGLQPGQQWTVTFQRGSVTTSDPGFVVSQRAITDPTGQTLQLQLLVTVPTGAALGTTSILASTPDASFAVPAESFTVIGKTLDLSELSVAYRVNDYHTAVGSDGTLYIGVGGLATVCQAMAFSAAITEMTPEGTLQADKGVIYNSQG